MKDQLLRGPTREKSTVTTDSAGAAPAKGFFLRMRYVPAFDGLRAVGALLVFLFHFSGRFPGGWVGVDIFFVLSGFLITNLLVSEYDKTGSVSLPRFYVRRAYRLLPALLLLVAAALGLAFWLHHHRHDTVMDSLAAVLYVENYRLALLPYADGTTLGHTWSLSVEEQFYLFWPLLLVALLRYGRGAALHVTILLIFLIIAWRSLFLVTHTDWFRRVYFSFDLRADELLMGCALALWRPQRSTTELISRFWPAAVLVVVAFTLKIGVRDSLKAYVYTVGLPILALASSCLLIAVSQTERNFLRALLSFSPVVALGRISYGFYLWHYLILHVPQKLLPYHSIVIAFVLTLLAATSSYWLVERPLLRLMRRDDDPINRAARPPAVPSAFGSGS